MKNIKLSKRQFLLLTLAAPLIIVLGGCAAGNTASSASGGNAAAAPSSASSSVSSQRVFTRNELKKYNGKNGAPAYVAVDGVVYDVTNIKDWQGGSHHGFSAGQDLTQAIRQSPHGASVLSGLPVVGKLQ